MVIIEASDRGRLIRRPIKDVHADLKTALTRSGLDDSLDYFEIAIGKKKTENVPFPQFEWLSCSPVTGKAGGHYIYVGTVSKNRHSLVFVGKTSKGFQAACEIANMCAEQLSA
ncbi:MAG: hypothetical protein HY912_08070 [Desulfomonile tiedjei]|uniref:Uncharacterized protein n=1 Tax=Desulfomonile tiedjei TaxID=2358 RepID=A0A9D6Z5S1_9BACT|nr:hypothetical protein [Desulfomonile tiedjei]